jgi:hypothetical protein
MTQVMPYVSYHKLKQKGWSRNYGLDLSELGQGLFGCFCFVFYVIGDKTQALHMPGKCSTTEPHSPTLHREVSKDKNKDATSDILKQ